MSSLQSVIDLMTIVARKLGLIDADFVMGIPLWVTGKSIYFDR